MEIINSVQEVLSSGLAFVVYIAIPAFIIIKAIRRKKLPDNHYTPVDDILDGKVIGLEEESDRADNS
ncbi:hypothetical protein [Rossellomorea sp. DUT-2]|uniref:hypothetical protein n=1 Tax=Rossellomorea sp. DUT-2 TaxID=3412021 RepID=UPI003D1666C6